ncbi:MAG TPA: gluconokinase [Ktedonobacterales bacterium]
MNLVIGLDLGTTTCKALALTPSGEVAASASATYPLLTPQPGWAEQDPTVVWRVAAQTLSAVCQQLGATAITAIGLSGAMHSALPLDTHDLPLAHAMTWADQRATPQAEAQRAQTDPLALYQRTGCPQQALYLPAKGRYWADQLGPRLARLVSLKEYVAWQLTGAWAVDDALASTTGLLDIHTRRWDAEALSLAGLTPAQLSTLVSSEATIGQVTAPAASATGLPVGTPVIAGGSDGGMAQVGMNDAIVITVGTSGAIRQVVSQPRLDSQARTWCYAQDAMHWLAGGAINNGGIVAQWAQRHFYPNEPIEVMDREVGEIAPGAEGVMAHPYLTGDRTPHWNATARATLSGFGVEHTRAHLARALLEGVAFCLADVWELVGNASEVWLTGGITQAPVWAQIVSDVLGVPLGLAAGADASAEGAARTALAAAGTALPPRPSPRARLEPDSARHETYSALHRLFQERYAALYG